MSKNSVIIRGDDISYRKVPFFAEPILEFKERI